MKKYFLFIVMGFMYISNGFGMPSFAAEFSRITNSTETRRLIFETAKPGCLWIGYAYCLGVEDILKKFDAGKTVSRRLKGFVLNELAAMTSKFTSLATIPFATEWLSIPDYTNSCYSEKEVAIGGGETAAQMEQEIQELKDKLEKLHATKRFCC